MMDQRCGYAEGFLAAAGAALLLACAHFAQPPQTLADAESRLGADPGNILVHRRAADLAVQAHDAASAVAHLQAILARRPGDDAALQLARLYLALENPQAADACLIACSKARLQTHDPAFHLELAALFAQLQDYPHADVEYNFGTAQDAANADAYCRYGMMLLDGDNPEKAVKILRVAVSLRPADAVYHVQLARALFDSGSFEAASGEFTAAFRLDPRCVPAYLELAKTYQRFHSADEDKKAEDLLRAGIAAAPDDPRLKVALATLLLYPRDPARRQANAWEAATLLQECVKLTGKSDVQVLEAAAAAWSSVGLDDQAQSLIDDALAVSRAENAPPAQTETLLALRQRYVINQVPPSGRNLTPYLAVDVPAVGGGGGGPRRVSAAAAALLRLALTGTAAEDPADIPFPAMLPQPPVETLPWDKPATLDAVPAPGSALDPACYLRRAGRPSVAEGMRP